MDLNTVLVVAAALLILFSGQIFSGAKWAWSKLPKAQAPTGLLTAKVEIEIWKLVALVGLFWFASGGLTLGGCKLPSLPDWKWPLPGPSTPTLVVILYEAQHGPLPSDAIGAANELTAAGREVRMVDDDVTDGLGETPDWLKPALEPGRAIMGGTDGKDYALVLLSGQRVVKAVKLPATKAEILEAAK